MPDESIDHISGVLAREDTVLFLGSGLSRWSGLPSWPELIEQLRDELLRLGRNADLVKRELATGDLLLAASYGVDQLTDVERRKYLRTAIQVPGATPSKLHEALVGLGPSCFITTNYDRLLEDALSKYRPTQHFDVVTPIDTLEIPAIVQARADHFVFKPHGDIGNCDSIVLTREDYRRHQGPGNASFEATRHLLASRPVVFVGFGLRDPDFLLMRDYLFSTFDTNPADHLAIMPDVTSEERGYWRRHYGIDLVSYTTLPSAQPESRHDNLLQLLERAKAKIVTVGGTQRDVYAPELLALTLARFGRGITSKIDPSGTDDFPLSIEQSRDMTSQWRRHRELTGCAESVLSENLGHIIVEGIPGSGKSYTIRNVARDLASRLETACLSEPLLPLDKLRIPVQVAMRDYRDDLTELIEAALPIDIPLDFVLEKGIGHFLLDGFNEAAMTSERENLLVDQLRRFLQSATTCTVVITTRNASQLVGMNLPIAVMGPVSAEALHSALQEVGIDPSKTNPITIELLRRPLFFSALLNGRVAVRESRTVHDIYRQLIAGPDAEFATKFGVEVPLIDALASMAFAMIDSGDISSTLEEAIEALQSSLPQSVDSGEVIDLLLRTGLLVATPLRRLAFYHHSITEYLAAYQLSALITKKHGVVLDCLGRRDWDQALMLSLGFLPPALADAVHESIMRVDAAMGLRSLHYIESEQEDWIERSLRLLPRDGTTNGHRIGLESLIKDLPLKASHAEALLSLAEEPNRLGGTALGIVAGLAPDHLNSALEAIATGRHGYNFCSALGEALGLHIGADDARALLAKLELVPIAPGEGDSLLRGEERQEGEHDFLATRAGAEYCLAPLSIEELVSVASSTTSALVRITIADVIRDSRQRPAVDFLRGEIVDGNMYAVAHLYMQLSFGDPMDHPMPQATPELISALIDAVGDPGLGQWALNDLTALVAEDSNVRGLILDADTNGLTRALLLHAAGERQRFVEELEELLDTGCDWESQPTQALAAVSHWDAPLLLRMLRTREESLAGPVLDALASTMTSDQDSLDLELTDLEWWLEWLGELSNARAFLAHRLGSMLGEDTSEPTRQALLTIFDKQPKWRPLLAAHILPSFRELTIDDFNAECLEWLLVRADKHVDMWRPSVVARIATEQIVNDRLLPLLAGAPAEDIDGRRALTHLLDQIGKGHGRRYVGDHGMIVD